MSTIIVCGHGPGISDAVAKKFAAEGFNVALVARSKDKLEAAAAKIGSKAKAFVCDLGDHKAVSKMVTDVRAAFGPITVIHWNAYAPVAGDLLTAPLDELKTAIDVSVTGLVAAVQASHADLKAQHNSAILVTGGGFAFYDTNVDGAAVQGKAMGVAIGKAAQHKLVGLLSQRLKKDNVYVGEVVVLGMVKGTQFDQGKATLEPTDIAKRFWDIYSKREELSVKFS